jgi:hypothetical protein
VEDAVEIESPSPMMIDLFASRIGVLFAAGAAIAHFAAPNLAPYLALALAGFTLLESAGDLCVGCVVYTYVALPIARARRAVHAAIAG